MALCETSSCLSINFSDLVSPGRVPNSGCGLDGKMTSFKSVVTVLVAMASAALRDFWAIEERERLLGPPPNRACERVRDGQDVARSTYRDFFDTLGRSIGGQGGPCNQYDGRAAHWRSEHYRKNRPFAKLPTSRQVALAAAFKRAPPEGYTWVRGASVAGVEAREFLSKLTFIFRFSLTLSPRSRRCSQA